MTHSTIHTPHGSVASVPKKLGNAYTSTFCQQLASDHTLSQLASPLLWHAMQESILNATHDYFTDPVDSLYPWLAGLMDFYSPARLERPTTSPAPQASMQRIMQIVEDYPRTKVPLRIFVFGGSITSGGQSTSNTLNQTFGPDVKCCSWSAYLQYLLNNVLFQGEPVVQVTNWASSAYHSEVSAFMMKYRLLKVNNSTDNPPDIVIWAHAPNDFVSINATDSFTLKEDFVKAAHIMRPCDPDLPMVIMFDDFYGEQPNAQAIMDDSMSIRKAAEWHQIMSVSYANVVRHAVYGSLHNTDVVETLFSSDWEFHLAMGFHIAMSWVMVYNLLHAFVSTCNHELMAASPHKVYNLGVVEKPFKQVPILTSVKAIERTSHQWQKNTEETQAQCENNITGAICEYSWIKPHVPTNDTPELVRSQITPYIKKNKGWDLSKRIKPAWYASESQALFDLLIPIKHTPVSVFTALCLRSYGTTPFKDSELVLTAEVISPNKNTTSSQIKIKSRHSIHASVPYPKRLVLPSVAQVNDTVRLTFELVRGSRFMIAGMALCNN
jgi:hypothetical protein